MRFAFALAALVCVAVNAATVCAQSGAWAVDYNREQASVSTNGVPGTWVIDRFVATWSRLGAGGWSVDVEHQQRGDSDDVALQTSAYRRAGDWTFGADAMVAPGARFLCRAGGGGEVSYRAVGALVVSGAYHFRQFPIVNIHQFEPTLTWYRARGEMQARVYVTRDATVARTSTAALFRVAYDVARRLHVAGGASVGDRLFNIDPLASGAASGRLAYGETRFGFSDRDFALVVVTAARENPDFKYLAAALGYKRLF